MHRNAYLESEVLSASPLQLVELLYRGAMEASAQAFLAAKSGDTRERSRQVNRAHAILAELSLSLDHSAGGTLSKDLAELYDYLQRRLNQANIEQRAEPLAEVQGVLTTLLEAWEKISKSTAAVKGPAMSPYQGAAQLAGIDFEGSRLNSVG